MILSACNRKNSVRGLFVTPLFTRIHTNSLVRSFVRNARMRMEPFNMMVTATVKQYSNNKQRQIYYIPSHSRSLHFTQRIRSFSLLSQCVCPDECVALLRSCIFSEEALTRYSKQTVLYVSVK